MRNLRSLLFTVGFLSVFSCNTPKVEVNSDTTFILENKATKTVHAIDVINVGSEGKEIVIYILDGEKLLHKTIKAHKESKLNQKFTFISIRYTEDNKRNRDFSISKIDDNTGEAASFLSFLKNDLDSVLRGMDVYDSTNKKVLLGHSLGGLFSAYSFLNDTSFFQSFAILSPVLFWDDFEFFNQEKAARLKVINLYRNVYLASGKAEDGGVNNGVNQFFSLLNKHYKNGHFMQHFAKRGHVASIDENLLEALKFIAQ